MDEISLAIEFERIEETFSKIQDSKMARRMSKINRRNLRPHADDDYLEKLKGNSSQTR